ncbi:MAG: SsrA-binding protein SmpB [Prevotellaceae bacterium]|jgi:SsrA-binding protein|nr:SsrA-binding protein SmpB [Prevotellaceae bacterium]
MYRTSSIEIKNKRASFDYELVETFTTGMVLTGTEIKSIREGKAALADSYCIFINGELWAKNINIAEYRFGAYSNHNARRDRKLLLQKRELQKLLRKTKEKGLTIVTLRIFINEKGFAKLDIALARGKKAYDKRESIKEKDLRREEMRAKG